MADSQVPWRGPARGNAGFESFSNWPRESLIVVAMRVHIPDCSPFVIHSCGAAPTPIGFLEVVGDNLATVLAPDSAYFPLHTPRDHDDCHRSFYLSFLG